MLYCRILIRNRLLQAFYRPAPRKSFMSAKSFSALDAIDKSIEEKITPLLSEFF
jgi:hypothetical protein